MQIKYISDGDVSGAISVAEKNANIDIYLGIGGGPEGVLAAAALSCLGGQIQTRLVLDEKEKERALKMGVKDPTKKYNINEMTVFINKIRRNILGFLINANKDSKLKSTL